MKKQKDDHDLNRIMVGNQIAIMRALAQIVTFPSKQDMEVRIFDVKDWWRHAYGEEVGFSTSHGDKPPHT